MTRNDLVYEGMKVKLGNWYQDEDQFSEILDKTKFCGQTRVDVRNKAIENMAEQCCDKEDEELENEEQLKDWFERTIRLETCAELVSDYKNLKRKMADLKTLIREIEGEHDFECVTEMENLDA